MFRGRVKPQRRRSSPPPEKRRRRPISVYDCVAGRVNANGFIPEQAAVSAGRITSSTSRVPIPPDESLFKQRGAPRRYEEDDIYFADRHLAPHQRLPESDLLKAIHAHSSEAYDQAYGRQARRLYRSLDETALLAFGVLLEEAAADLLDETCNLKLEQPPEDVDVKVEDGGSHPGSKGKRKRDPGPDNETEDSDNGAYHDVMRHWLQYDQQTGSAYPKHVENEPNDQPLSSAASHYRKMSV
ncbi:uncharacterized protein BKCO1_3600066 [Diplodia corticola]|uniref:Fungal protein n=1 Tax=Diplodia corticola TaxID=236234 RepID=A0A1J9RWR3_9PEZI|nr:uncharacterized protein BKCO1_3600066 [Diplodia corticola]OJD32783.1 fungal protein [Diplodia corticola]